MAANKGIDWSNLAVDYAELKTQEAVAKKYGCNRSMVSMKMKSMGIQHHYDKAGDNNPKWRGGRRKDQDGYIQVFCPDHPHCTARKEVSEHRLVMENTLGRYLDPTEIVHHINGTKDDNRPENLELIGSIGEHVYGVHHDQRTRDATGKFISNKSVEVKVA